MLRSPITTCAPASAKVRTIAAPMPLAPPETKARRPSSRPNAQLRRPAYRAPCKDGLAPLDHGGKPFARIGHAREFGHRAGFFRQALLDALAVPAHTSRLVAASAFGAPAADPVRSQAKRQRVRSGTTLLTIPRAPPAPLITGLVSRISIARRRPTRRDKVTETPASGAMATRVAPAKNLADLPAMTISEAQTSPKPPPPAAKPCTE